MSDKPHPKIVIRTEDVSFPAWHIPDENNMPLCGLDMPALESVELKSNPAGHRCRKCRVAHYHGVRVNVSQSGQPRPYADHEYVATAHCEPDVSQDDVLAAIHSVIGEAKPADEAQWYERQIKSFSEKSPGVWSYHARQVFLD